LAVAASTWSIGRAGAVTGPAFTVRGLGTPISSTLPQVWHSGQRPTHFTLVAPHSTQRYPSRGAAVRVDLLVVAMVVDGSGSWRQQGGGA
jgi:hypothetical protein